MGSERQKIVAVDLDGTIGELHEPWLSRYNADYHDNKTLNDLTSWDMHHHVKKECGTRIYHYLGQSDLYDHVTPVPGAREAIERIREHARVIFVSSCASGTEPAKVRWLKRCGFLPDGFSQPDWYACADKSLIDADLLIDDHFGNCEAFVARNPNRKAILIHRPWNETCITDGERVKRTPAPLSWRAIADYVCGPSGARWVWGAKPEIVAPAAPEVKFPRIAFVGFGNVGKDEAAKALYLLLFHKCAFGDIIKRQIDPLVQKYFGFSAFTENDGEKARIRPILEQWGEVNYDAITEEFFRNLPERAVNTRLVRVREARQWKDRGGIIVEIQRPGVGPATDWERDRLDELCAAGLIDYTIENDGTPEQLQQKVLDVAFGARCLDRSPSRPSVVSLGFLRPLTPRDPLTGAIAS